MDFADINTVVQLNPPITCLKLMKTPWMSVCTQAMAIFPGQNKCRLMTEERMHMPSLITCLVHHIVLRCPIHSLILLWFCSSTSQCVHDTLGQVLWWNSLLMYYQHKFQCIQFRNYSMHCSVSRFSCICNSCLVKTPKHKLGTTACLETGYRLNTHHTSM